MNETIHEYFSATNMEMINEASGNASTSKIQVDKKPLGYEWRASKFFIYSFSSLISSGTGVWKYL